MNFGELRSLLHNGNVPSPDQLEELSRREDYHEVIKPYLMSFEHLFSAYVYNVHSVQALEEAFLLFPFVRFDLYIEESLEKEEDLIMSPAFEKVGTVHLLTKGNLFRGDFPPKEIRLHYVPTIQEYQHWRIFPAPVFFFHGGEWVRMRNFFQKTS